MYNGWLNIFYAEHSIFYIPLHGIQFGAPPLKISHRKRVLLGTSSSVHAVPSRPPLQHSSRLIPDIYRTWHLPFFPCWSQQLPAVNKTNKQTKSLFTEKQVRARDRPIYSILLILIRLGVYGTVYEMRVGCLRRSCESIGYWKHLRKTSQDNSAFQSRLLLSRAIVRREKDMLSPCWYKVFL